MDDPNEELEPLFDYSRVQPLDLVSLDDDDDDSIPIPPKKQKLSEGEKSADANNLASSKNVIKIDDGEDEEDWLPSPVKVSIDTLKREEDSMIKAIRLKKQELLSYAQSAEDILQNVDEPVKKNSNTSDSAAEPQPKPSNDRAKIVICIQDKDEVKHFRVYMDDKFEKLLKMYADKVKLDVKTIAFSFDGDKISPTATPADLGMEDEDIVEVHMKAR
ncbi:uncharacterized protein LOC141667161 [Apium graveolens]|uniref:uncharacterized protein LOC141667161 n=1 Tax=Apium graveolens TaxID=4045 RepID=UPI003D79FBCB